MKYNVASKPEWFVVGRTQAADNNVCVFLNNNNNNNSVDEFDSNFRRTNFCHHAGGCPNARGWGSSVLPTSVDLGVRPDERSASSPLPPAVSPQRAGLDPAPLPAADHNDEGGWRDRFLFSLRLVSVSSMSTLL